MNREIKFRAWGYNGKTDKNEMFYNYLVSFNNTGINTILKDMQENVVVLMQYTGLKDKNGIEIYEGDIVMSEWGNKHIVEMKPISYWNMEGGCAGFGWIMEETTPEKGEIIGNIYENPELIENYERDN